MFIYIDSNLSMLNYLLKYSMSNQYEMGPVESCLLDLHGNTSLLLSILYIYIIYIV